MHSNPITRTGGWLAFELSVLKRLKFKSVTLPFTGRHDLGNYLKQSGIKVHANDPLRSSFESCLAHIGNDGVTLSPEDVGVVLEDAYVPQYRLRNPALRNWFGESDAWWFDNVRTNIDRLGSRLSRASALSIGIKTGDYALSFDEETRRLRQPLSRVFERLLQLEEPLVENGEENICRCANPVEFTAESYTDLFFLQLPQARSRSLRDSLGDLAWKEVWVRGDDEFWHDLEESFKGRLGSRIETRSQYVEMLRNALDTARHIKQWAVEHVDDGFIHTQDVIDAISEIRKVDTVFTKDFSELTGMKAVIITA